MSINIIETIDNAEIKRQLLNDMKLCIEKAISRELMQAVFELRKISKQITELTKIIILDFCPPSVPKQKPNDTINRGKKQSHNAH